MRAFLTKVNNSIKRTIVVFLVYSLIFVLFSAFMNKDKPKQQVDPTIQMQQEMYRLLKETESKKTFGSQMIAGLTRVSLCFTIGEACTDNPKDGGKNYDNSLFGSVGKLFVLPFAYPAASGIAWTYDGIQNIGLVPKVQAAGVGFHSLLTFQPVWKALRNVTYIAIVLIVVTIGFLIMFRVQINPQTVISIENAIPRIVLTLLFITFSYAIAGFVIDLAYILIFLIFEMFSFTGLKGFDPVSLQNQYLQNVAGLGIFAAFGKGFLVYITGLQGFYQTLPQLIKFIIQTIVLWINWQFILRFSQGSGKFLDDLLGKFQINAEPGGVGFTISIVSMIVNLIALSIGLKIAPVLLYFVFAAIVVFGLMLLFFRIFFLLIGAYVQIILNVILAPILILPHAIPGNDAFFGWLRKIFGYMLVFPTVTFFLVLVDVLFTLGSPAAWGGPPPGQFGMPLLDGLNTATLVAVFSATMLAMLPDLVKAIVKPVIGEGGLDIGPGNLIAGAGAGLGSLYGGFHSIALLQPHLTSNRLFGDYAKKFYGMLGFLDKEGVQESADFSDRLRQYAGRTPPTKVDTKTPEAPAGGGGE